MIRGSKFEAVIPKIDSEELEKLAALMCTYEEIADWFKIGRRSFIRLMTKPEWRERYEQGRSRGKISIRRAQLQEAQKGNPALLVWLGKQYLDQRETLDVSGPNGTPIAFEHRVFAQIVSAPGAADRLADFAERVCGRGVAGGAMLAGRSGIPGNEAAAQTVDVLPASPKAQQSVVEAGPGQHQKANGVHAPAAREE